MSSGACWRIPPSQGFAKDGPKTWRKLNGVMCLATQSPSDVLESSISRTLIEQTPTKIIFPNADANWREYTEGFGLTEREYRLIKDRLEPGSRMFLVKQGHHSVVCELDLKGFDAELAVISGRAQQLEQMRQMMSAVGPDPAVWLPLFTAANGAVDLPPHSTDPKTRRSSCQRTLTDGLLACLIISMGAVSTARAQMAVIDAPAIAQLVQEVQTMRQQLQLAQAQLLQAQQALQSMTGNRGHGAAARHALRAITYRRTGRNWRMRHRLAARSRSSRPMCAVRSIPTRCSRPRNWPLCRPCDQQQIVAAREARRCGKRSPQEALVNASGRFAAIQSLIAAIGTANDQKAILDLQTRITAELGMLQNEQTKLQILVQANQAQDSANVQREREQVIAGQGRFASRFRMPDVPHISQRRGSRMGFFATFWVWLNGQLATYIGTIRRVWPRRWSLPR